MPIRINEIVIRAQVSEPPKETKPADSGKKDVAELVDKDNIVQEAVEQVLQILRHKKER
jgi:hypothetical protein